MRVTISLRLAAMLLVPLGYAHAEDTDDSLRVYAVNIIRHPTESWTGKGIYLGKGLIITVAHVVGWASRTNPRCRSLVSTCPRKRSSKARTFGGST